jgi:hypothetical protein
VYLQADKTVAKCHFVRQSCSPAIGAPTAGGNRGWLALTFLHEEALWRQTTRRYTPEQPEKI